MFHKLLLKPSEEREIVAAILKAETNTSGEIRIHVEQKSEVPPYERARQLFEIHKMNNTRYANGVLIYVCVKSKGLAILGDRGINEIVSSNFWESTKDCILRHFRNNKFKQGLVEGVLMAGEQLQTHFPYLPDDRDELPNEILKS